MEPIDEGLPIAYEVLEQGVPVFSSEGEQVGTVERVVAAPEKDIFHGIVMRTDAGRRDVAADLIESLHERGVDLRIDANEAAALAEPHGAAPAWRVLNPGAKASRWGHLLDRVGGRGSTGRDWRREG